MKYLNSFSSVGALNNFYKGKDYEEPNVNVIKTSENEDPMVDMSSEYEIICFFDTTENLNGSSDLITNYDLTSLESIIVDGNRYRVKDLPLNKSELEPGEHIIKLKYKNKTTFGNLNSSPVFMNAYLKKVIIPKGIETLNTNVFYYCQGLDYIKIPNTVKSISTNGIFVNGSKIKTLDLSEMDPTLFNNSFLSHNGGTYIDELICPNNLETTVSSFGGLYVKKVNLGKSLTEIPSGCFSSISSYIEEVIIPNTVTSIGGGAFNNCSKLTSINIPNSVTSIGISAFNGCSKLTSIIIPESVTSIGEAVFNGCSNLEEVNISNNSLLTNIGDAAFNYCSKLTSINIPDSVTAIGNSAFNYCSKLTSINIPDSVTSIGEYAFNGTKLINVNITNNLTSIGGYAFALDSNTRTNVYFDNSTITSLGNIMNPSTIKTLEIGPNTINQNGELCLTTFGVFYNMESIIFPEGLTVLPNLSGSSSLKTFNIPSTITTIADNCFKNCNSLEDSYIEDGIKYIDIDNFGTYFISVADYTLQHYTIKNGFTSIPFIFNSSFTNIQSVILPQTLTIISNGEFDYLYDNDILTSQQVEFILNINPNAITDYKAKSLMKQPTSYFEDKYFSIYALGNGNITYRFMDTVSSNESTNYKILEYSKDNGETWLSINNIGTSDSSEPVEKTISALKDDIILFRSTIEPYYVNRFGFDDVAGIGLIHTSFNYYVMGNIMSLLYGDNFINQTSLSGKDHAFRSLFNVSGSIYENYLKRADKLILPATTLAERCYQQMFEGNKSLTTIPELPATILTNCCYEYMFEGCTSLTTTPELPATTLAEYCYTSMFNGCTSLKTAPELSATTLANSCYSDMFNGCTALTTAPELPATTLANYCYYRMFNGCTSLTTASELPATTLVANCYDSMFKGCKALTTAPELPATTLANYCYEYMFEGCSSLKTAPELPATTLAECCYYRMFNLCNCITESPILSAPVLVQNCYLDMFTNCNRLTKITMLATDISAFQCVYCMSYKTNITLYKHPNLNEESLRRAIGSDSNEWVIQDYVAS